MSSFLVTGASGFIGLPLCHELQDQQQNVTALLRKPAEGPWQKSIICDLGQNNLSTDDLKGIDSIIHLAGIAHRNIEDKKSYGYVNTEASVNLAATAAKSGVKNFIFISSVNAVEEPGMRCIDESWDNYPTDAYGKSKRVAEEKLIAIGKETGMAVCILRPALVYGVEVKGNLEKLIKAIRQHKFPPIPEFHNKRSMVSVDDLISAILLCIDNPVANGKIYIVSDNHGYSTKAMYLAIKKEFSQRIPKWWVPRWLLICMAYTGEMLERLTGKTMPFDLSVYKRLSGSACYLSGKLQQELGWKPNKTFYQVLPDMIKKTQL